MWRIAGGIFMGWSLGSNDAANIFGIGITSRLIRFRTATILLSIFVILGAYLEGPKCYGSLQKLGDLGLNQAFICTFSAGLAVLFLTILKIPASTSQAIVGAIIGAAILTSHPNWSQFVTMAICWVFTPVGGAIIGYILYLLFDCIVRRLKQSTRTMQRFLFFTMILSGCFGSYALGANNVANTTGVYVNNGLFEPRTAALIGGVSIALGAATFSRKVMDTIGNRITIIGPQAAVIATLAHSLTVYLYTHIGVPVSSS
jgi:inorganic phosphate transporter, PiT family